MSFLAFEKECLMPNGYLKRFSRKDETNILERQLNDVQLI